LAIQWVESECGAVEPVTAEMQVYVWLEGEEFASKTTLPAT